MKINNKNNNKQINKIHNHRVNMKDNNQIRIIIGKEDVIVRNRGVRKCIVNAFWHGLNVRRIVGVLDVRIWRCMIIKGRRLIMMRILKLKEKVKISPRVAIARSLNA